MHPPGGASSEGILHVFGRFSDEVDVFQVPGKRCLFGGGVDSLMIIALDPFPQSLVEALKAQSLWNGGEELGSQGLEPAFDFASSLRFKGAGMHPCYAQRGCDMCQVMGAEPGGVVHIELSCEPPFAQSFPQRIIVIVDSL